jgi:hypothetical protein
MSKENNNPSSPQNEAAVSSGKNNSAPEANSGNNGANKSGNKTAKKILPAGSYIITVEYQSKNGKKGSSKQSVELKNQANNTSTLNAKAVKAATNASANTTVPTPPNAVTVTSREYQSGQLQRGGRRRMRNKTYKKRK